jgi:hypothetical protein
MPSAGIVGSELVEWARVVFKPNANRTMPATIGKWR